MKIQLPKRFENLNIEFEIAEFENLTLLKVKFENKETKLANIYPSQILFYYCSTECEKIQCPHYACVDACDECYHEDDCNESFFYIKSKNITRPVLIEEKDGSFVFGFFHTNISGNFKKIKPELY